MNFASKAAFVNAADEDEGEEVYEEDLLGDMPMDIPPPLSFQAPQFYGDMAPIPEANEDLFASNAHLAKPQSEEAKREEFSSLAPGSSFSDSLAGKQVSVVKAQPSAPREEDPFSSLSAGAGFSSSLQGKEVNLIREKPQERPAGPPQYMPPPGYQAPMGFSSSSQSQSQEFIPPARKAPMFMKPGLPPPMGMPPMAPMGMGPARMGPPGGIGLPPPPMRMDAPQMGMPSSCPPMFPPPQAPNFPGAQRPAWCGVGPQRPRGQIYKQQVDSNVVDVPLNILKEETPIATGDPQFCGVCRSLLSATSTVVKQEDGSYKWKCEFCDRENQIFIEEEEVPKQNKLTYVLESAADVAQARVQARAGSTVIFVLDTSGSMCVTQATPGKFALKTSHISKEFEGLLQRDDGDQYFPGQDRNTTYVSRLECVQAAIEAQLGDILLAAPDTHVGLITFSEEVKLIGDGLHEVTVAGDKLHSSNELLREVEGKYQYFLGRSISETKELLLGKVMSLQEKGATALGPAALMAVQLAKEGGPGAKVILCTDGIANVGLGSLESNVEASLSFYQTLSETAKDGSVLVSVLSIEGEECKLNALLPLAVNTGGDVNKVNPLSIRDDFANVLSTKTIATGVEITVNLHKALKFRNVDQQHVQQHGSRLVRKLGTVCENETFLFEYCTKTKKELQEEGVDLSGLKQVPFQVLVQYQRGDGMKCVFADTQVQQVTSDREAALQHAEYDLLARNAQIHSSNLVMEGRYQEAQLNSLAWGQAMVRNQQSGAQVSSVQSYFQGTAPLYNQVNEQMRVQAPAPQAAMRSAQPDSVALTAHKQQQVARKKHS